MLLGKVALGDEGAFAQLVKLYGDTVFGVALAYAKNREIAEEIMQDVFMRVWSRRERLGEVDKFESWLFIMARNLVLNAVRDQLKKPLQELVPAHLGSEELTPYHTTEARDNYRRLLEAIEILPEKRKAVFKMSRIDGLTHKQIAAKLGIHEITVAQYITKALVTLRERMESDGMASIVLVILLRGW
jgi:RNA polymerase sigma-70 factor (family 1)